VHLAAYFAASWIPGDEGRRLYADARRLAREHADHQLERVSLINEVDFLVAGVGKYAEATRVAREMLTVVENYAAPRVRATSSSATQPRHCWRRQLGRSAGPPDRGA
jgi:hypothetical protein